MSPSCSAPPRPCSGRRPPPTRSRPSARGIRSPISSSARSSSGTRTGSSASRARVRRGLGRLLPALPCDRRAARLIDRPRGRCSRWSRPGSAPGASRRSHARSSATTEHATPSSYSRSSPPPSSSPPCTRKGCSCSCRPGRSWPRSAGDPGSPGSREGSRSRRDRWGWPSCRRSSTSSGRERRREIWRLIPLLLLPAALGATRSSSTARSATRSPSRTRRRPAGSASSGSLGPITGAWMAIPGRRPRRARDPARPARAPGTGHLAAAPGLVVERGAPRLPRPSSGSPGSRGSASGPALGLYAATTLVVILSVPSEGFPLVSMPRFVLTDFPVLIALAAIIQGRPRLRTGVLVGLGRSARPPGSPSRAGSGSHDGRAARPALRRDLTLLSLRGACRRAARPWPAARVPPAGRSRGRQPAGRADRGRAVRELASRPSRRLDRRPPRRPRTGARRRLRRALAEPRPARPPRARRRRPSPLPVTELGAYLA